MKALLITYFLAFLGALANAESLNMANQNLGLYEDFKKAYSWGKVTIQDLEDAVKYRHVDHKTELRFEIKKHTQENYEITNIRINGRRFEFKPAAAAGMIRATISGVLKGQ